MKIISLSWLLAAMVALPGASQAGDAAERSATAAALIPAYAKTSKPADLVTLYRLQLAARRFGDAEATLNRLSVVYASVDPRRVPALVPLTIFARAKRYQAAGAPSSAALRRAFRELYDALPDDQMARVLPWYDADLDALRADAATEARGCEGRALATCATAAEVIAATEAVEAWTYLMPASEPLLRADAARRFVIDDQILVPTPDGAMIAVMIVRPRVAPAAKLTALLNFTIYAKDDWSLSDAITMAAHGYAGVVAYTRGKGRSPGAAVPYEHDGDDAATVIEWLARQPWSDARVGMFSGSYNGFTQWSAAKRHPPALKAIATNATNAPGIDTPMQGNVFQSFIYPWPFYTTNIKSLDDKTYGNRARWAGVARAWYASGRPYGDMDKIDGTPNPVFDTWLEHPAYDAYWQRLIPYKDEFASIDIPVFVQTGYYDGGMVGALYYFAQHLAYRPAADHRMLIGPYHHTAMQTGVLPGIGGADIDRVAVLDLQNIRLQWFDHVFRGAPLPDLLSDRINFEVMGANTWRHVSTLDAMATERRRLYMTGTREGGALLLRAAPAATPPPVLKVNLRDRSDADFQPPANAPDVRNSLVWETAPLESALEVDGVFTGQLDVTINKRDVDLAVNFYELRADGQYLDLASYLGRASFMQDRSTRHLLQPGRSQTLSFQSQTLTARLLSAGSRIVVVVGVPKVPSIQINYGTGRDVSGESIEDAGEPLQVKFASGSHFELGVREAPH
ncbi:hypothetical protein FHW69_003157 [Luteibacter sp. Sphag1AF]|uniref:CocE/NonD family hydrolase n=1 Tax=Luteibacter sp. Sphag1AF TaxID=2587031 RepID=UPI0016072422|nr:CocE/NonD family hydrolase [Luteibacter sp. Sphag1AF]MBB3228515.1 hypothetical protein [Luteibacter sp. Sphag1AF]